MVARRRLINADGQYEIENGSPKADAKHTSTVVWLLRLEHGTCVVAPDLGNRIWTELKKLGTDAPRRAEHYAREALRPLTRDGRITLEDVTAEVDDVTKGLYLSVVFVDPDGREQQVSVNIPRGA